MGTDPAKNKNGPAIQDILNALDDPDCRTILKMIAQPMTVTELTDSCEIPESTLYRKLNRLSTASLVREIQSVHPERGRVTRYQRDFDSLNIFLTDDDQFDMEITRPKRTVNERLAAMWSEMGEEL